MSGRTWLVCIAALTILALVRVGSTLRVFAEVLDEPAHLAAGWQWFGGTYSEDPSHPPLARILFAAPLRLAGLPDPLESDDLVTKGNFLLYVRDHYEKHLARARLGNLLLLGVAIAAVAAHALRSFGREVAVAAVALFTSLPPILGHAGLATTDLAAAAAMAVALLFLDSFVVAPTVKRGAALGLTIAFGVLSKFSFLVYFPAAALVLLLIRRPARPKARALAAIALAAFLGVWAGYRFHVGKMAGVVKGGEFFGEHSVPGPLQKPMRWVAERVPVPAPELAVGLGALHLHNAAGHDAFLLGRTSKTGWWYYFPVVFFYKTPLPLLALAGIGVVLILRRHNGVEHALMPLAILLVATSASINIGVRHILPIYAPLAIAGGYGAVELWRLSTARPFARLGTCALLAWLFVGVAASHPDYLAWFNEAAGAHPERIAVDSNLDWGQDFLRLERAARELKIEKVYVALWTNALYEFHSIPAESLPKHPVSGWIAVGESTMAMEGGSLHWLEQYEPVRRVGSSIRLYYVPPHQ